MKHIFTLAIILMNLSLMAQTVNLELFATGFRSPTDIMNAGDDRLFIVERGGLIKILNADGSTEETPYLDIDAKVFNSSFQDERGLLGLAFHPDYSENGYLFVNYSNNSGNTVVERFQVDPDNPNFADAASGKIIIEIAQPEWNHNGGCLRFGADGYLYIGMGDGGSGNDPWNNGQNKQTMLGKMLRIDIDNGDPYAIPADNPFVGNDEVLDEIWAIGMRNPWKFSFDKNTGDLWIADVGQNKVEEVDFEPAGDPGGHNYGWRCYEGKTFTNNNSMADCNENYTEPVFEVQQTGFSGPCSITGGYMYRGSKYLDLQNRYICADYCSGEFFTVESDGNGGWTGGKVAQFSYPVSTFGEDVNGELYIASFATNGRILKVVGGTTSDDEVIPAIETVSISPNPFNQFTDLRIETKEKIELEVFLIDMTGKVVLQEKITVDGLYENAIDLSKKPSGTYILSVNSDKGLITKQLVKYD